MSRGRAGGGRADGSEGRGGREGGGVVNRGEHSGPHGRGGRRESVAERLAARTNG